MRPAGPTGAEMAPKIEEVLPIFGKRLWVRLFESPFLLTMKIMQRNCFGAQFANQVLS
jgi:hypothetical protein